jgi:uncharacterized OB-fold protein
VNQLAEAYDAGLRDGRLLVQSCDACGQVIMYPKWRCPSCSSDALSFREASGTGTLYSYTVQHHTAPTAFADQQPYALGIVKLSEGVQLLARLVPGEDGGWSGYRMDGPVEFCPVPPQPPTDKGPTAGRPCAWFWLPKT